MSSTENHPLFQPAKLGSCELRNRFIMAPLTRSRSDEKGLASDLMAKYYAQRSHDSGAGLIISEATNIEKSNIDKDVRADSFGNILR